MMMQLDQIEEMEESKTQLEQKLTAYEKDNKILERQIEELRNELKV